jgi:capsule polysaccharide export protein KpsC/LpsZ
MGCGRPCCVAQICQDVDNIDATSCNHHEDTDTYKRNFLSVFESPYVPFLELVNPFTEEEKNVVQLCSKVVMEESISQRSDAKRRDSTTSFCLGQTMQ